MLETEVAVIDRGCAGGAFAAARSRRVRRSMASRVWFYRSWRVNPQIGQVATSVVGSTMRKLVQPLVLQ
jgi:hypothetical protein